MKKDPDLSPALQPLLAGCELETVSIGCSAARVFRVRRGGLIRMFLKAAPAGSDLRDEAERLSWLHGRVRVPRVVSFVTEENREYLLTEAIGGADGTKFGENNPEGVVVGIARELKAWHSQPTEGCPFDHGLQKQIERVKERVELGLVDESDFDEKRRGRSAGELLQELLLRRPETEENVLTHGDACLPNVIFEKATCTGFVDCGRAGVADPYQDIALASRSIESNLGAAWVSRFFEEYGAGNVDQDKIDFFRLLDEFF